MQRFTAQCSSETHCIRKQFLYKDTNPYLKWRAYGHAFPKLLPPARVLSSPCCLRSGKRTASQEQLQCASSPSAAPFCTAWAMSLLTSSGAESLGQHIIYLHWGTRAPFFRELYSKAFPATNNVPELRLPRHEAHALSLLRAGNSTFPCLSWRLTRRKGYLKFKDSICGNTSSRKSRTSFSEFYASCHLHDFPGILS